MISRRTLLTASLLTGAALSTTRGFAAGWDTALQNAIAALERRHGGRLGVAVLNTNGGKTVAYRGDERFPLCSTFKCLAAAFVLARVDNKEENLSRKIVYKKEDLVANSPTTEKHVGNGLTMTEICEAAITLSDNTAGNLMLDSFGGPAGLTKYLRSLGDNVTRLDRRETELNEAAPGDPRDTTTPVAMLETLRKIVLGNTLSDASREQLTAWLVANKTGGKRLRAGLPEGWKVGDKTGSGNNNTANDVAVLWPQGRAPVIVTAYYTGATATDDERNMILADVGRFAAAVVT
ncbi:class A beta-lactamase [Roseiarcaceae bacterium H3SJ34-1]|uniref:class A beta-lactamase n=1 Tax=Terripilifer ovatus TaxID=3032367 RepID=UPI003AB9219F|nr:class A beta-lactamase [Roseiarcaceae bacterium H3SJ34-1]